MQWAQDSTEIKQKYMALVIGKTEKNGQLMNFIQSNNYTTCIDTNWNTITGKMAKHANMLLSRRLTLHQRVSYANSCLLSKLWYVAHIYPLTPQHAKEANKILFNYVWGASYEPIKRATIYRPKRVA